MPVVVCACVCGSTLRGDPEKHRLPATGGGSDAIEQIKLVEIVDNHAPDSCAYGVAKLLLRLVIAMEENLLCRKPRLKRHRELSAGHDVESHALFLHNLGDREVDKGLGSVQNA